MGVPPEVKTLAARDLFERARKCARDAAYLERRIERMRAAEGVRGASLSPSVSGARADVSGTARVDARMDFEAMTRARLDEDHAVMDYACAVLYGSDGRSGLSALYGSQVADLLWRHYLGDESWETSAEMVGMPPRSCYRRAQAALDLVDFLSPEVVMAGEGGAT